MITAEDYIYQLRTRDGKPCRVLENFFLRGESEKLEEIIGQEGVAVLTKRYIHKKEVDEFLAIIKAQRDEAETNNVPPNFVMASPNGALQPPTFGVYHHINLPTH